MATIRIPERRKLFIRQCSLVVTLSGCSLLSDKHHLLDPDGDGSPYGEDCDDTRGDIYPGAEEICEDGIVNDCESDEPSAMAVCGLGGTMSLSAADLKLTGESTPFGCAGGAVSTAGDVDGDGLDDVLIGAHGDYTVGLQAGAAYLLLGGVSLSAASGTLSLSEADLKLTGEAEDDSAGWSVASAGDVDGDRLDDLLVGSYGADGEGEAAGAAYLLLGGSALHAAWGTHSLSDADLKLIGESASAYAGYAIAGAGDVDGNGLDDLIIGAYQETSGGAAYLLLGGDALDADSDTLSLSGANLKLIGEAVGDRAGRSVSGAGDVDGDGLKDLVVGALYEDSGGEDAGAAYLLLGGGALYAASETRSLSGADLKLTGEDETDYAGDAVSGAGDVDGDGLDDLIVGAYGANNSGQNMGAAYLLLGGRSLITVSGVLSLSGADLKLTSEHANECAACAVSGAGDVDGDGLDDLLVGAPLLSGAYLLLGGGALSSTPGSLSLSGADLKLAGDGESASAGMAVAGAGDVNADGFDELLVGACGGLDAGAAYLIFGGGY